MDRNFQFMRQLLRKGQDVESISERLMEFDSLPVIQQAQLVKAAFTYFETPKDFKKILNVLIESGKIDFSKALSHKATCDDYSSLETVLYDERIRSTVDPKIIASCSTQLYETYNAFRISRPGEIEHVETGHRFEVPVANGGGRLFEVEVVETTPCRWEVTESALSKFNASFQTLMESDSDFQELVYLLFPAMFPSGLLVSELSAQNRFRHKPELLELIRSLGDSTMDIHTRRSRLIDISYCKEFDGPIIKLVRDAYNIIKNTQVIKAEFTDFRGTYVYFVLYDCSKLSIYQIAEEYDNNLKPVYDDGKIISHLPELYNLEQATEINSWITHGLLSLYLIRPDFVKATCTNPFIGNEDFWSYVQRFMDHHYTVLHSASRPLEQELIVYRGSPHFKPYAVRLHSIFATSKKQEVANRFSKHKGAKIIKLPAGTRVLDLSKINRDEQEVLVFPSATGANMVIEPVEKVVDPLGNRNNRNTLNTYRIRNVTNRNRNLPRSRRRRFTRKRR